MLFLASHQNSYWKVQSESNFVIRKYYFRQHLVGISQQNHFHVIPGNLPEQLLISSIRVQFRHSKIRFWSMFSRNFNAKPLPCWCWHHARTFTDKFDQSTISSLSSALSINMDMEFHSKMNFMLFLALFENSYWKAWKVQSESKVVFWKCYLDLHSFSFCIAERNWKKVLKMERSNFWLSAFQNASKSNRPLAELRPLSLVIPPKGGRYMVLLP